MTQRPAFRPALFAVWLASLSMTLAPSAPGLARGDAPRDELAELQAAFESYAGVTLVFAAADLPKAAYYDRMPELSAKNRLAAARIAVREVKKYPRGYLGRMGLGAIGVFDALVSDTGDGFRPYDSAHQGYLYYGLWNGKDGIVAAYYTDGQLPLTLHHEIFHHVDGMNDGALSRTAFLGDDERFQRAVAGTAPYPAPAIPADDLARLRRHSKKSVLEQAVSDYAAKNPGEDQAETARYLMTNLPDALVQMVDRPDLPGSQRMLHVLTQYEHALDDGPAVDWFVDVALGRQGERARGRAGDLPQTIREQRARVRARWQPRADDTAFSVRGTEDEDGVNWTLRADLADLARDADALTHAAARSPGTGPALGQALLANLRLLARYQQFIEHRWSITRGTQRSFDQARAALIRALPEDSAELAGRLAKASYADLAEGITAKGAVRAPLVEAAPVNPHLAKVDRAVADPDLRAAIRAVQPATVRFDNGSGVNIDPSGRVLTAAHVVDRLGATREVAFPDGRRYRGRVTAIDHDLDLALVTLVGARDLPSASIAPEAPRRGDRVVVIGQPGSQTPEGEPTGYEAWYVSVGHIRGFLANRTGSQKLGRTKHDAWTYWGHSGSPLFDEQGRVVALHNSWDAQTAMRHAVTWEAIAQFLDQAP